MQPANRSKTGMFDDAAPIWRFLAELGGTEDPEAAQTAQDGLFYFEVFPALALASIGNSFFGRLAGPRYNPARRKTFRMADWHCVRAAVADDARRIGCDALAEWCDDLGSIQRPVKADQDRMDAAICLLIALRWRLEGLGACTMVGDLEALERGDIKVPLSRCRRARRSRPTSTSSSYVNLQFARDRRASGHRARPPSTEPPTALGPAAVRL